MNIVLATSNSGKIKEFSSLLQDFDPDIKVLGLKDFPQIGEIEENGKTFEENALIKAKEVCKQTGLLAIADDSGLEVDALGGEPGIYSARYSGQDADDKKNIAKLLLNMLGINKRQARFVCAIAVYAPSNEQVIVKEHWEGEITLKEIGENGFGYDPVFWDPELNMTSAQMSAELKNSRSHRARALKKLALYWPDFMQRIKTTKI